MRVLENQFVSYGISLKLTGLGFDRECLGVYDNQSKGLLLNDTQELPIKDLPTIFTLAPLWQQAFDFIREKYNLLCEIYLDWGSFYFRILKYSEKYKIIYDTQAGEDFGEYQEAREKALEKLIEICSKLN